jgi:C_GCAxxG_C_C family probable redox protein
MRGFEMKVRTCNERNSRLGLNAKKNLAMCGNCAQTTFLTLRDEFGLEGDEVLKALTPLPGIALRGETCGAVTGSLMILGLVYGRDQEKLDSWQAYLDSLPPSRRFCREFESELGSTTCGDIVADQFGKRYDLADPVQAMEWLNCGALERCGQVISIAVCIAAEILQEIEEQVGDR